MIPELGHFALILALCLALAQSIFPLVGAALGYANWMAAARPLAVGQGVFLTLAFGCLAYAFIHNDFSVLYVTQHSNSALPSIYRFSAVWGGHEGSLLLWTVLLSGWGLAVAFYSRGLPLTMAARVLGVMGAIGVGFLLFMLLTSNPFERLLPAAADGRDLNPLLQDPGLVVHPPMLYMGYVGFSVAFAFAIAALLGGQLDSAWARWARPWTLVAWIFLTLGIALGSWWAYYELGWGGWWFWDPVENASFMPWLVGTALIHSLAVTEKRGSFKSWTVLLAILAFSLSLLGTFLVRSGVLTSVHAFASDPSRGIFILVFLGVTVGISFLLFAWRAPAIGKGAPYMPLSREVALFINNILLLVITGSVLLGTLYPLFLDALGGGKISVGPPYFDKIFFMLMIPLIILLGIGPLLRWKDNSPRVLTRLILFPALAAIVLGTALVYIVAGVFHLSLLAGVIGALWIVFASWQFIVLRAKPQALGLFWALARLSGATWGMLIAHIGVAVFVAGVMVTNTFSIEKDLRMAINAPVEISGYTFVLENITTASGPNYDAHRGTVRVTRQGREIAVLYPEKRIYRAQTMPMTEAAIDAGLLRDLYVALGEPLPDGAWAARVYYKPLVRWIWLGALLMALGGLLAAMDKRYARLAAKTARPHSGTLAAP